MQTYNEIVREYIINKGNELLNKECEEIIEKDWNIAFDEIKALKSDNCKRFYNVAQSNRRDKHDKFEREQKKKYEELLKGSYEEKLKVVLNDFYGKEVIKNTYFGDFKEKKKVDWIYILLLVVSMVKNILEVEFMREV